MDNRYMLMILAALTAGTVITRFLPFLLFPQGRKMPRYVEYLGGTLPYATMGLLVVYCLKGVDILWDSGDFVLRSCGAAPCAEKKFSFEHRGGDCALYGSGAGRILGGHLEQGTEGRAESFSDRT